MTKNVNIRNVFSFTGRAYLMETHKRSLNYLKGFMQMIGGQQRMTNRLKYFFKLIVNIQTRAKNRSMQREARVEVLHNYWRKLCNKIEFNCLKKDRKTSEIIKKIMLISPNV